MERKPQYSKSPKDYKTNRQSHIKRSGHRMMEETTRRKRKDGPNARQLTSFEAREGHWFFRGMAWENAEKMVCVCV
jgi:hypothetical protein